MKRVCIVGAGAIGSLYAAHLARVAEVWVFARRPEHAHSINQRGIRVTGRNEFHSRLKAHTDPRELPAFDFGIVATKANQTREAFAPVAHLFGHGAVLSAQNGLGSEEILAELMPSGYVIRGTTFMSGTRFADDHVHYELNTATWMGPFEPANTPFELVEQLAALINASGLKAEALPDARPAQWSKLIFNASVNAVSALSELPHSPHFAAEAEFGDLGHLLHALIEEGKTVAAACGIELHEDPWKMNCIGAQTNHPPSMLYDIRHQQATEVDFLGGAIAREAQRVGVPAPLHTALYRLIKAKETSWSWKKENVLEAHEPGAALRENR
ncbi:MAG TPA: 2-dehydropantoate 2-reductase [Terriglobales bacterium]|jgi:2-dehydropantoate 2-reductase|nr:2-dehydropantoate 2-reductase [Terriglobales bacterium]